MFTGKLDWPAAPNPLDVAGQWPGTNGVSPGDDSSPDFALLFDTILALTDEPGAGAGAPGMLPGEDAEGGDIFPADASPGNFNNLSFPRSIGPWAPSGGLAQGLGIPMERSSEPWSPPALPLTASPAASARTETSGQPAISDRSVALPPSTPGSLNKTQLSQWMDAHALTRSSHHCAMYCRLGMEAAGMSTVDRPQSGDAADYGPYLLRHGAQTMPAESYVPAVGDVVVFDKTEQHPFGHIEMYDGRQWVSDFKQHSFSPYRDASSTPPFTIYRLA